MQFSLTDIPAGGFEDATPHDILAWAFERFGDQLAIASSFGIEDVALIDIAVEINPDVRVFTLDTGRLHQATYDVMDRVRNRYDLKLQVMFPQSAAVEAMVQDAGVNLFYDSRENRKRCCGIRKVEPLRRAMAGLSAWVTGLRRDQNVTRAQIPIVEIDAGNGGIAKINPLATWSEAQVWDYVKENRVPYNKLHDSGFPSIGCEPCTRPVAPGEDPRSGRWWWENAETRECGLHLET